MWFKRAVRPDSSSVAIVLCCGPVGVSEHALGRGVEDGPARGSFYVAPAAATLMVVGGPVVHRKRVDSSDRWITLVVCTEQMQSADWWAVTRCSQHPLNRVGSGCMWPCMILLVASKRRPEITCW